MSITTALKRYAEILLALAEFYTLQEALKWMESEQPLLKGQRPIALLTTDEGFLEICAVIARLQDGAYI